MTVTTPTPDWLIRHGGELRPGVGPATWLVLLGGTPQYRLYITPAQGRFACVVTQAVSGRRLDHGGDFPDANTALQGGLEDLRLALGW